MMTKNGDRGRGLSATHGRGEHRPHLVTGAAKTIHFISYIFLSSPTNLRTYVSGTPSVKNDGSEYMLYVLTPHFEIHPTHTHLSGCWRQLTPADAQSYRERRGAHGAREVVFLYRHDRLGADVVDAPVHNRGAGAADGRDTNGHAFTSLVGIVIVHDGEGDHALGLPVTENYLFFSVGVGAVC